MTEVLVSVEAMGVVRDLAVDGDAPVGDLLPALAGALGVPGAWRVVDGARILDPASGLAAQGVVHGSVLRLVPAV